MSADSVPMRRRFHYRFWEPKDCIGGKVYFGTYYEPTSGEGACQTHLQFHIKRSMGLCYEAR